MLFLKVLFKAHGLYLISGKQYIAHSKGAKWYCLKSGQLASVVDTWPRKTNFLMHSQFDIDRARIHARLHDDRSIGQVISMVEIVRVCWKWMMRYPLDLEVRDQRCGLKCSTKRRIQGGTSSDWSDKTETLEGKHM